MEGLILMGRGRMCCLGLKGGIRRGSWGPRRAAGSLWGHTMRVRCHTAIEELLGTVVGFSCFWRLRGYEAALLTHPVLLPVCRYRSVGILGE